MIVKVSFVILSSSNNPPRITDCPIFPAQFSKMPDSKLYQKVRHSTSCGGNKDEKEL